MKRVIVFGLLFLFIGEAVQSPVLDAGLSKHLKSLFQRFTRLGRDRPPVGHVPKPEKSFFEDTGYSNQDVCDACEIGIKLIVPIAESQEGYPKVVEFAKWLCIREQWYPERVCKGAVDMFKEEFYAMLPVLQEASHTACSTLLKMPCGDDDNPLNKWWNITIPPPQKERRLPIRKSLLREQVLQNNTYQILHLSDMHMDPLYVVGAEANCTEPLCCRADSPSHPDPTGQRAAGKVGDYNCDTSPQTMSSFLTQIGKQHRIDAVYITGDLNPHDVWNQTRERDKATIGTIMGMVKSAFGSAPVYFAVGNHEGLPVNAFPTPAIFWEGPNAYSGPTPKNIFGRYFPEHEDWKVATALPQTQNMSWLYDDILIKIFIDQMGWLPNDTAKEITRWLFRNSTDPQGELKWLVDTLYLAEQHKERVHIFMHIPSGDGDCLRVWSWNYYNIVYRFRNTIAAQFSGHTHDSYFVVYYDEEYKTPTGINYVGPSITTYTTENPAYQLLTVDATTLEVLDYDIYYVDLPTANKNGTVSLKKLYSAKADLNLPDLSPQSWHNLTVRMQTDDALFQKFHSWLTRMASNSTCDASCKRGALCELHQSRNDPKMCDHFLPPEL